MVFTIPKSEVDKICADAINNPEKANEIAVKGISEILRGNKDEFKIHHIIEEVWSLKECLKHFFQASSVAKVQDNNIVMTVEELPNNLKLYPLPQPSPTKDEVEALIKLIESSNLSELLVTVDKLKKMVD